MTGSAGFLSELCTVCGSAAAFALMGRQILSLRRWSSDTTLFRAIEALTEPWLVPVRRHLPRGTGIDLSVWAALALVVGLTLALRLLLSRGTA